MKLSQFLKCDLFSLYENNKYILLLGISSFFVVLKVYLYSFYLDSNGFSEVNKYLIVVGVFTVFSSLGLSTRCHTVLPGLYKEGNNKQFSYEVYSAKTVVSLVAVISIIAVGIFDKLLLAGVLQGYLYSLFFIDQIAVKSRMNFTVFGFNMLGRNAVILIAGYGGCLLTNNAIIVVVFEVVACLVTCIYSKNLFFHPVGKVFNILKANISFLLVTVSGVVVLYIERVFASYLLSDEKFAIFSYMYIIVLVSYSLQQFVKKRLLQKLT